MAVQYYNTIEGPGAGEDFAAGLVNDHAATLLVSVLTTLHCIHAYTHAYIHAYMHVMQTWHSHAGCSYEHAWRQDVRC